jgi:ABC-type phosphate transport system substrate-binding protein
MRNLKASVGILAVAAAFVAAGALVGSPAAVAKTVPYAAVSGAGSSLAAPLIEQWASYTAANHQLTVNYQPDGSAEGRRLFIDGVIDFAASDVPFLNGDDKLGHTGREVVPYGYSYIPDVAGGTAFMYHLSVGGRLIRNLRLSGQTLMKIFTGKITNWDNPQITRDYGKRLPDLPIIPVVHSDGAGTTYYFTRWMAHMFPAQWNAFCAEVTDGAVRTDCGQTEFYPTSWPGDPNVRAENGSANVASFIASRYANGAIGYDEYAYALASGYPVVRLRNPAGRYVLPTARNVTVALTQAIVNENPSSPNYLQQNLDNVYTYKNPESYPLSSYSYLIVPRATPGKPIPPVFTKPAGRSLSAFIDYFLCAGQADATRLGYAPLPVNLVKAGLLQVRYIPGHAAAPRWAGCR